MDASDLPRYHEFIMPAIRAVKQLGGSGKARELREQVLDGVENLDELIAVTRPNRPEASVLVERVDWGRSYAKLIGALEVTAGVYLLTDLGKELLTLGEQAADERVRDLDREFRRNRPKRGVARRSDATGGALADDGDQPPESSESDEDSEWSSVLLTRLHQLTPEGFEEFVLYLLRQYGLQLKRVGGPGDEGVDGIGTAPISPVLSSRVAVQVKRYAPSGTPIGRDVVALFQRDAMTKGAERAILVTLGRFSKPAQKAATDSIPTVDLIDGARLAELVLEKEVGVKSVPVVNEGWFDRFDGPPQASLS